MYFQFFFYYILLSIKKQLTIKNKLSRSHAFVILKGKLFHTGVQAMTKSYNLPCNIAGTLDIIGDRWTLLIIRDLFQSKTKFNDLKLSLEGISPNILSERLQLLEQAQIVTAHLYSQHPPRYEYHLTKKGRALKHVLAAIAIWGNQYLEPTYTQIVHTACGTEVQPHYLCPHCNQQTDELSLKVRSAEE